jgi:hypothetical protein
MPHDLSALRLQLRDLQQQLAATLETFLAREPLLPGSVYTLRRRCGKPTCHCARGELHASIVLAYRGQAGPRNLIPTAEQLPALRELTDAYRRFRQNRTQLLRLTRHILAHIDRIEAARVEEGERRFQRLRPPSPKRSRR